MMKRLKRIVKNSKIAYYPIKKIRKLSEKRKIDKFQTIGYELNDSINRALKDSGLQYFCAFGTLLGIVRDKGFIKHDSDLDYYVLIHSSDDWRVLLQRMLISGFRPMHFFLNNECVSEFCFEKDGIQIDFFGYFDHDEYCTVYGYYRTPRYEYEHNRVSTCVFTMPQINRLEDVMIHNSHFYVPSNAESILEICYGTTWRTPIKGMHSSPNSVKMDDYLSTKIVIKK